jgi:hypothetical protein
MLLRTGIKHFQGSSLCPVVSSISAKVVKVDAANDLASQPSHRNSLKTLENMAFSLRSKPVGWDVPLF